METAFLSDIVVICGLAVAVVYICHRIKIPTIIAFLLTGVLAGPHVLGLVHTTHQVTVLAELGVVLLLFTIGLEFSFSELAKMRRPMLLGGSLQVCITIAFTLLAGLLVGLDPGPSIFLGFMAALSSTAIVLKLLEEKSLVDSPPGRTSLAILIFQDVAVVAMLLLAPLLTVTQQSGQGAGLWLFVKGIVVVLILSAAAKWGVTRLLDASAGRRDRELFVVTIAVVFLGVAWLTSWAGLSLALGAFLAGLMVAESQYGAQTVASVLPLRDLFISIFFVSVGMLLDLGYLVENPGLVGIVTLGILLAKTVAGGAAGALLGYKLRVSLAVGLSLSQVGEFSFVLAQAGQGLGLISPQNFQLALAASVLTMMLTPSLIWLGQKVAKHPGLGSGATRKLRDAPQAGTNLSGHIIIVGYGINGRNVARAAELAGIAYLVVEMNPVTVKREHKKGKPVYYGDAVNQSVLEHVGLARARALVIALADPADTRRIVAASRAIHPGLYIIARTRYMNEVEGLAKLGADEVIPEEYETSVEIFARVLRRFGMPEAEIGRMRAQLRSEGYNLLRRPEAPVKADLTGTLGGAQIATLRVQAGSEADGSNLAELALRKRYEVNVLALNRDQKLILNLTPQELFQPDDLLIVLADPQAMTQVSGLFRSDAESVQAFDKSL